MADPFDPATWAHVDYDTPDLAAAVRSVLAARAEFDLDGVLMRSHPTTDRGKWGMLVLADRGFDVSCCDEFVMPPNQDRLAIAAATLAGLDPLQVLMLVADLMTMAMPSPGDLARYGRG